MPSFDIVKKSEFKKNFRTEMLKGQYDIQMSEIQERFSGSLPIEGLDWNVGLIYGASGTGKTTIAKEIFGSFYCEEFRYDKDSIVDDFDESVDMKEITEVLNHVGFSSPPSWLKPYDVLSTGEKMRVNLARAILSDKTMIVFDEFTSTVDRVVAKVGSVAIQKAIRKLNKKFVAVSCHSDIIEWLNPDWIFNTDSMKFENTRGLLRRPEIEIRIFEEKNRWELFRKYHYLSNDLNKAARQFVGYYEDSPVCFVAILHMPHAKVRNMKRVSRIVVLPDYQGIGIGVKFLNKVGDILLREDSRLGITTSHYSMIKALRRNKRWAMVSYGRKSPHAGIKMKTSSSNRLTASFEYTGDKNENKIQSQISETILQR